MYIVDYSTDYQQRQIETTVIDDKTGIIDFIADRSVKDDFRIKRINKYENGKLHAYQITLVHGRIDIEFAPVEGKS